MQKSKEVPASVHLRQVFQLLEEFWAVDQAYIIFKSETSLPNSWQKCMKNKQNIFF